MKLFIPLLGLLSMVVAEPPVGDGYPAARSHDDHHDRDHSDLTRSPSQEYGPPQTFGSSRNTLSTEYGPPTSISPEFGLPNARLTLSEYGPPNARTASPRQKYSPPAARVSISHNYSSSKHQGKFRSSQGYASSARNAPSQEYGAPRSGLSEDYGVPSRDISGEYGTSNLRSGPTEQYGVPNARTISQEYGTPNTRSSPDQDYGAPNTRGLSQEYGAPQRSLSQEYVAPELSSRTLSTEYGVPDARSTPSEEYGAPAVARSGINKSRPKSFSSNNAKSFRNSQSYSSSNSLSHKSSSQDYTSPARSNDISQTYSAPKSSTKSAFGSRSQSPAPKSQSYSAPGSSYEAPAARNSDSYSQEYNAPSESYGVPAVRDLSDTYGVPSARGLSQEYRAPTSRANLKTNAIVSSYSSARSSPSSTYVPSARSSMPLEQYGVPNQYDASNQGYNYARGSLDDSNSNQEPANYDFTYKVNDFESGSDFGHSESREDNHAEGSYFVVLPDGTKQIVEYEADEDGFKPRISVEPASARSYDENSSDLSEGY